MESRSVFLIGFLFTTSFVGVLQAETPAEKLLDKPDAWFQSDQGREVLGHVLSWQTANGDWPKNTDTTTRPSMVDGEEPVGTFDNGATTGEIRVLTRGFRVTGLDSYRSAALTGIDHVLAAQYPNGGWPQHYPLSKKYHRHITFNDGTMIRLLVLLGDVVTSDDFAFVGESRRIEAQRAIAKAHECIVKCQVRVNGIRTVWCAQHHAETLLPVQARSYEHPSLSGAESAGILRYLMGLNKPSTEIIEAIESGVAWFEKAKIEGYRYQKSRSGPALTRDAEAPPLWARFYEIETNVPIFSDRDGIIRYDLQEVSGERRGGYTWYGNWGSRVLEEYDRWRSR